MFDQMKFRMGRFRAILAAFLCAAAVVLPARRPCANAVLSRYRTGARRASRFVDPLRTDDVCSRRRASLSRALSLGRHARRADRRVRGDRRPAGTCAGRRTAGRGLGASDHRRGSALCAGEINPFSCTVNNDAFTTIENLVADANAEIPANWHMTQTDGGAVEFVAAHDAAWAGREGTPNEHSVAPGYYVNGELEERPEEPAPPAEFDESTGHRPRDRPVGVDGQQ